jgi:hypothetical protein
VRDTPNPFDLLKELWREVRDTPNRIETGQKPSFFPRKTCSRFHEVTLKNPG